MITVPDDYPTIQSTMREEEAQPLSEGGTYFEHVTVNNSISLIGENIDGKGESGTTVDLIADNIIYFGFNVQNGGYFLEYSCRIQLKRSNSNV